MNENQEILKYLTENPVAAYGVILSSILTVVKLWEIFRNRARLTISHSFNPQDKGGIKLY